ncbi:MAG: hypothetical protein Q4F23_03560 [Coriobacteriia bacterium]|nr:hypothetical protein [Coriobacteriia bacterium]
MLGFNLAFVAIVAMVTKRLFLTHLNHWICPRLSNLPFGLDSAVCIFIWINTYARNAGQSYIYWWDNAIRLLREKGGTMDLFDKSFDPFEEVQKAADSAGKGIVDVAGQAAGAVQIAVSQAGQAVGCLAGKAGEMAEGVKQGIENAKTKEPDEYELAVIGYNQTYTDLESGGIELYQSRLRSIDLLDLVTELVSSIANTPKSFSRDIEYVSHRKRDFKESETFAREELDLARKSAANASAGVAAGMAVASIAPSAAMWVATTFGTASTGVAISTLSGAAATNAAMAWLGGGALAAGGGGMAAGSAFLAMAGPIGWGVAGATLLTSIALFVKRQHEIVGEKHEELLSVKRNTEALRETSAAVGALRIKTDALREELSDLFMSACCLYGADYLSISDDEKLALGSLVNSAKALGGLIVEKVAVQDGE